MKVVLILLLLSWSAHASVFLSTGPSWRFEQGPGGVEYETHTSLSVMTGYSWPRITLGLEYLQYEQNSGTAFVQVQRRHQEINFWTRYMGGGQLSWIPYVGLGLGVFEERVRTHLGSDSIPVEGKPVGQMGLSGGIQQSIWRGIMFSAEGRAFYAPVLQTDAIFSASLLIGFNI